MRKRFGFLIIFLFFTVSFGFAQGLPPGAIKQLEERLSRIKKENPQLYEFEKKLLDTQKQIQELVEKYRRTKKVYDEGTKKEEKLSQIKEEMRPLIKEQMKIRNNPDYQAEMMLMQLLGQRQRF